MSIIYVFFVLSAILIIFPFVIYPLSLKLISLLINKEKDRNISDDELPTVTLIITAYNEEKVIKRKLEEAVCYEYPEGKFDIIVASDDSTDLTNQIVQDFISKRTVGGFPKVNLLVVKGRRGKTVAQNVAVKSAEGEIVSFSDANSTWDPFALKHMMKHFVKSKVGYVCGQLKYINTDADMTSHAEGMYWNFDLEIRKLESRISSIVGGNGAIYAIKKGLYVDLPPLLSHDGFMPTKMVLQGATAKYEERAIAFEKASENSDDEFNRKVRMQRGQPWKKYTDIQKFNVFKYGWFSYFYFGHKYVKYLLYILHPMVYITNLLIINEGTFFLLSFIVQSLFYLFSLFGYLLRKKRKIKLFYFPYHYSLTIVAQMYSIVNTFKGKSKATWEKSETTR
jgi:glycosyltransferase involved in cell wall biosynthesis